MIAITISGSLATLFLISALNWLTGLFSPLTLWLIFSSGFNFVIFPAIFLQIVSGSLSRSTSLLTKVKLVVSTSIGSTTATVSSASISSAISSTGSTIRIVSSISVVSISAVSSASISATGSIISATAIAQAPTCRFATSDDAVFHKSHSTSSSITNYDYSWCYCLWFQFLSLL